jgi:hypothetical protein
MTCVINEQKLIKTNHKSVKYFSHYVLEAAFVCEFSLQLTLKPSGLRSKDCRRHPIHVQDRYCQVGSMCGMCVRTHTRIYFKFGVINYQMNYYALNSATLALGPLC